MASTSAGDAAAAAPIGAVVFAYDGSGLARLAIEQLARQYPDSVRTRNAPEPP